MQITYSFDSGVPGKNILILGSIHGDEPCGSIAIERLRKNIVQGDITLISGSITCIPYANYRAYSKEKRQITHNLNRIFGKNTTGDIHDVAREIESYILKNDFILDLHSFSSGRDGFIFNDFDTPEVNTVIKEIPIQYVMTGWTELYSGLEEMDTIGFAKKNNIPGITIECGQNEDSKSIEVAYEAILSVLGSYELIQKPEESKENAQIWVSVDSIVRKKVDFTFAKEWTNFDTIKTHEIIGKNPITKESIPSPYDGIIILPNASVEDGGEWCYLGKIIHNP